MTYIEVEMLAADLSCEEKQRLVDYLLRDLEEEEKLVTTTRVKHHKLKAANEELRRKNEDLHSQINHWKSKFQIANDIIQQNTEAHSEKLIQQLEKSVLQLDAQLNEMIEKSIRSGGYTKVINPLAISDLTEESLKKIQQGEASFVFNILLAMGNPVFNEFSLLVDSTVYPSNYNEVLPDIVLNTNLILRGLPIIQDWPKHRALPVDDAVIAITLINLKSVFKYRKLDRKDKRRKKWVSALKVQFDTYILPRLKEKGLYKDVKSYRDSYRQLVHTLLDRMERSQERSKRYSYELFEQGKKTGI